MLAVAEKTSPRVQRAFPQTIDEHPVVIKHRRQRQELKDALTKAKADQQRLTVERQRLLSEHLEGEVAALLGDGTGPVSSTQSRVTAIDVELAGVARHIVAITSASQRLEIIAKESLAGAERDVRENALAEARGVVTDMLPLVDQIEVLNDKLIGLTMPAGGYGSVPLPFRPIVLSVEGWLQIARQFIAQGR